jgi:hypothetical protein
MLSSLEPGGPVGSKAKRGNPPSIDSSGSAGVFQPDRPEMESTPMTRNAGSSARDRHAVGLALVLGAAFGAMIGAAIGAGLGDVGGWMGMGIPAGASIGLALGALFSKAGPRSEASASRWTTVDDGPSSGSPLTHDPPRSDPSRLPAA